MSQNSNNLHKLKKVYIKIANKTIYLNKIRFYITYITENIDNLHSYIKGYLKNISKNEINEIIVKNILDVIDLIKVFLGHIKDHYFIWPYDENSYKNVTLRWNYIMNIVLLEEVHNNYLFKQHETLEWELDLKTNKTLNNLRNIVILLVYEKWLRESGTFEVIDEEYFFPWNIDRLDEKLYFEEIEFH